MNARMFRLKQDKFFFSVLNLHMFKLASPDVASTVCDMIISYNYICSVNFAEKCMPYSKQKGMVNFNILEKQANLYISRSVFQQTSQAKFTCLCNSIDKSCLFLTNFL